jgi:hypothetical protein
MLEKDAVELLQRACDEFTVIQDDGLITIGHDTASQRSEDYESPANAQLAQWAYQQMMFNAQQGGHVPHAHGFAPPPGMHGQFNPFPSGTPPPRPGEAGPVYPSSNSSNSNSNSPNNPNNNAGG